MKAMRFVPVTLFLVSVVTLVGCAEQLGFASRKSLEPPMVDTRPRLERVAAASPAHVANEARIERLRK